MSYFEKTQVLGADSPSTDAFGRWRVSTPYTIFDSKQTYSSQSLFWDTLISGTGTASFQVSKASTAMDVSGSGSYVLRQTIQRFNYQPGKSQLSFCTFTMSTGSGLLQQVGTFCTNGGLSGDPPFNGIFFERSGSTNSFVIMNSGSLLHRTAQSSWNLDKLDGTGPSGITLNLSGSQILVMDFEWLGVGRVRFGFVQNGIVYYAHQHSHANTEAGVYTVTPNYPVHYGIRSLGGSGSLEHICSTIMAEGGQDPTGIERSYAINSRTPIDFSNVADNVMILAMRIKSGYECNHSIIRPDHASVFCVQGTDFEMTAWDNVTISNSGTLTWQQIEDSPVELATGSSATLIASGTRLHHQYTSDQVRESELPIRSPLRPGVKLDGTRTIWALSIRQRTNGNDFAASVDWIELP